MTEKEYWVGDSYEGANWIDLHSKPWWKYWLARLFGQKNHLQIGHRSMNIYLWHGDYYGKVS